MDAAAHVDKDVDRRQLVGRLGFLRARGGTVNDLSQIQPHPCKPSAQRWCFLRLSLLEHRYVQVAPAAPLALGDVLQPGGDRHERRLAVGERAHHPRPAADLAVGPPDCVARPDPDPVAHGEGRAGGRLGAAPAHDPGGGAEPHRLEVGGDAPGLGHGGPEGLLHAYGLERCGLCSFPRAASGS